ncbi:peptidyl-dipeptidase Dcp [Luteimonas sp. MC1825]|uniref:peptidyl-dipeptidase Dcp n=1 Tax=Luteimonas sp. MC1825 TaxID=2761107 RepID=UPI00161213EC|nr:peptidyl-dipeptidase Dcp [Luteimonas sp. MC1825]MBB6598074.1 peptidyl-dipeptidase Dcp [Luteimonas sp. MC1825]QOC88310.1 peptidyl-dipeptidase Dcp [Luteimonas sp. MC1825]
MLRTLLLSSAIALALSGCDRAATESPMPDTAPVATAPAQGENPLLAASTLPFQAPVFDRIEDSHYQPAIEEGMRQHLAEVRKIADNAEAPSFANTIEALERSGALLTRAAGIFSAMTSANTNPTLQASEVALAPKLAEHGDAIHLDPALFARVKSLHAQRADLGLTPEQLTVLERTYEKFVRAGAELDDARQAELRKLNSEESSLTTAFSNKLLAAGNAGGVFVDDVAKLDGLDAAAIAAAADAAKAAGKDGQWLLPLQNTSQQPVLASLKDRALREQVMAASLGRAEKGDGNDTRATIQRLAELRARKAELLGYPSYAAYGIADQMAVTPEVALKLLTDTVPAATARAKAELAKIQAVVDAQGGGFTAGAADWDFYAEQVRKAEFDLDEAQIKPYFELDRVLKDGVFFAAEQLYGITAKERTDLPVYHPDVRVFDIFDADGKQLALFYLDPFKRESKQGGAWMGNFVEQNGLTGDIPVIYNVENYTKPAAGQPALLSWDDVTTLFHEYGHALHGIFSKTTYPSVAGTNTPRDFVEFPSQFNEHWALDPKVFANYAKHHETGEAMPQALVDKIVKARTFNQGYATTEYLSAALLDMAWHTLPASDAKKDVDTFEREALAKYKVDMAAVPPRYRTNYFSHIWGGGYAAGYYAYFGAEVLDHDAFQWFRENGGLTRENGQVFRDRILSIGQSRDLGTAYREFRGKEPSVEPLLLHRGLK